MRTKKAFLNLLTDVIPLAIVSVIGIFKLKIFLQFLGDETLGLYQLFSQIMVYVALVDGGLSTAVLYSLYKPNAKNDKKAVSRILSAAQKTFSKIGMIVFGLATLVSFLVPFFIKDSNFDNTFIIVTFILYSLSSVINYFFVPYSTLLEVREKKYIVNLTTSIGQIVKGIVEIILVMCGFSFPVLLVMYSIVTLISCLFTLFLCKKYCPGYSFNLSKKDYSFKKQLGPLLFHKINGLFGTNIAVIILSKTLGLGAVAIYATYNYIVNMLQQILGKITSSLMAILGNYMVSSKNKIKEIFNEFNSMMFYIANIVCVPLLFAINGFIDIWYENEITTTILIAISFVVSLYVYIIKFATTMFIQSAGLFKETQYCALTDTIVTFILSLILINLMGVPGALFAVTISVIIAEMILKTKVLYKNLFKESSLPYHIHNIKFILIFIVNCLIGYLIFSSFNINNIIVWFLVFSVFTIINSLIILGIYYLIREAKFMNRVKVLLKKI